MHNISCYFTCVPSKDSDLTAHPKVWSNASLFAVYLKGNEGPKNCGCAVLSYCKVPLFQALDVEVWRDDSRSWRRSSICSNPRKPMSPRTSRNSYGKISILVGYRNNANSSEPQKLLQLSENLMWFYDKKCVQKMAERLALLTSVHGVAGSNPAGGEILPEPKRRFIAQSLSCSPFHRLEMTEILLKGRKTLTHPSSMCPKDEEGMANGVDPDETAACLGLHCLPRHACLNI